MVADVDLEKLDVATLSWLAGSAGNEYLLAAIRSAGHPQLRISHGYVFQLLMEAPRTVGEIAEGLAVTQQAASKVVSELISFGYLVELPDPLDRRIKRIALSDQGHRAVADARAARMKLEKRLSSLVGPTSMRAVRKTLISLLEASGGLDSARRRRVKPPAVS